MIIRGSDAIFTVADTGGANFQPICCARNITLTTSAELGETSTVGTGLWRTYKRMKMSFTISAGGLVSFDMNYSIATMRQRQINGDNISFQFLAKDAAGRQELYAGGFLITSIATPGNYANSLEYSLEGQGTGSLTITQSTPSALNQIYYGVQDTNADPVSFASFINSDPVQAITINYGAQSTPKFFWMAHAKSITSKLQWQDMNEGGNAGNIGAATDLFEVRTLKISGVDYWLYMTRYVTTFADPDTVKYF